MQSMCERGQVPGKPKIDPISPRQLNRAFTSAKHMAGAKSYGALTRLARHSPRAMIKKHSSKPALLQKSAHVASLFVHR
jgi:hypothetical protein